MDPMKNYRQLLKELPSNKVVFAFGRFQPPTVEHELQVKVVKKLAEEQRADHVIYASKALKEDLLPADKKVQYMNLMFPNTNIKTTEATNIVEAAKELNKKYKNLIIVTSADCKEEYERILNKKNGSEIYFETIEVIAAGNKDPEINKLCESAKKGDYVKFRSGLPSQLRELDSRRLMNDIRISLGLDMVKEDIKVVKNKLREQYFRKEILNVGDIVESEGTQYEIVKRGANHLLLKEESGELVSKWIQDVTVVKEAIIQPTGTDALDVVSDTPAVNPISKYNIAKDRLRYKDFKKLNAMNLGKVTEDEEGQVTLDIKQPNLAAGRTLGGNDNNHLRRKIGYHLGEASSLEKFRADAAERQKKHDEIEAKRKAAAEKGEEGMSSAIDRLEKHLNKEETELAKSKKKVKKETKDDFKPTAINVKLANDDQQVGVNNAHGFDAFFNQ